MLTFFRRIRKGLIDGGATTRYLFYATGEIALVVLGILIALQINNWNETRNTEKLMQELYVMLKASIRSDTVSYNRQIAEYEESMEAAEWLQEQVQINAPYSTKFDTALSKLNELRSNESDYRIFDRILAVGIENIKDNTLTNELQHYYDDSKGFVRIGKFEQELLNEIYSNYFVSYWRGIVAKPANWQQLKTANEFRMLLHRHPRTADHLINRTNHRKDLAIFILRMLDDKIQIEDIRLEGVPYSRTMAPRDSVYSDLNHLIEINN